MNLKIGEKIRSLRLQRKMTQEQLADRLGISYQSVSRWENGVTYPDIEFLPAIAKYFSVSVDELMGFDETERKKELRRAIRCIGNMTENDTADLIELIRACRREQGNGEYFRSICYALRYTSLWQNSAVIEELRKSKEIFFETCSDVSVRSEALGYYACLEEERHIGDLLDRYASDQTTAKDYLLKERYLFRDEFDKFSSARQRFLHKQICYLIDGDISLWRDSEKPMDAEYTLFENQAKLALLHSVCREVPTERHPITCGNAPDVFCEQRIYIGMRQACAYAKLGEFEKTYNILEDITELFEALLKMSDETELACTSPALQSLSITLKRENGRTLYYRLENGDMEFCNLFFAPGEVNEIILLTKANYARWGWLKPMRSEQRFLDLVKRLEVFCE